MRGSDETWTMALHFKGLVSFMMNFGNCVWWNLLQPIWCEGYTPHETTKLWLKTVKLSLKRTKSTWKPFRSSSQETMPNLFNLMMHQIIGAYLWSLMGDLVLFQNKIWKCSYIWNFRKIVVQNLPHWSPNIENYTKCSYPT